MDRLALPSAYDQPDEDYWREKEEEDIFLENQETESDRLSSRLRRQRLRRQLPSAGQQPTQIHATPSASPGKKRKKKRRKWPAPIFALEFQRTSPADTMAWLVLRMQEPLEEGGVEAYVRIVPPVKDMGTTLLLSCSTEFVMKIALFNRIPVWQPTFSGPFRDECAECTTGTIDSGLVTSEKQRLFIHALYAMPAQEAEASTGIPGREQLEVEPGVSIISHVMQIGIASRIYPLHEPEKLGILNKMNWALAFFDDKNWDGIREYFGIPIGIHFLFCSMVTRAILGMSLVGLIGFGMSWFWNNPQFHVGVVAIANLIFAALFPKLWRQKCSDVAPKWGMTRWDEPAPKISRMLPKTGRHFFNVGNQAWEKDYPRWKRMVWAAVLTIPSLFFVLMLSMMTQLNYLNVQENHWWEKNDSLIDNLTNPSPSKLPDEASVNDTVPSEEEHMSSAFSIAKLLIQNEPWGHWIGFRIMMVIYAAFVVLMGYVVKCVVNVTTAWENHKSIEIHERIRILKLASALFAVNFLPLYATLATQRNLLRINELLLYVMVLDILICLAKRYFVCTWVTYCITIFREESATLPYPPPPQEPSTNFMVGLRHSLTGRASAIRHHRAISTTPTESSSSSGSLSPNTMSPRGRESHTCRAPTPPPSIPALHKCLAPPPEDVAPLIRAQQGNVGQWVTTLGRTEQRIWEAKTDPLLLPFEGWFGDHDEVLIRFSRAFLFPVLYLPLALMCVVGSMAMLDADGKVLCQALQRPVVTLERGLGQSWQVALEVISWMILLSNGAILYFSFAAKELGGIQQVSMYLTMIVAGAMTICIKLIVMHMLPDCPSPPPPDAAKRVHAAKHLVMEERRPRITCRKRPFPVE